MAVNEKSMTKTEMVSILCRTPHEGKVGKEKLTDSQKFSKYIVPAQAAVKADEEFFAHLIAWNNAKGEIKDSKIVLPLFALGTEIPEFKSNGMALLGMLDPRSLRRAVSFAREAKLPGRRKAMAKVMTRYLQKLESNMGKWERAFIQHRDSIFTLYGWSRLKASPRAGAMLRGEFAAGSDLAIIRDLHKMTDQEAAAQITERKIPFLVAKVAMGKRFKETDVLMALIERMSPAELVANMRELERAGVSKVPALRGALDAALAKASTKKATTMLRTSKAADAMEDSALKEKLRGLQEKQINKSAGIEGDWLILADKSGSMNIAIESARHIAAALTRFVKGNVTLVFFDNSPRVMDVTGKSYDDIAKLTKYVTPGGGTSIGCGLAWALENKKVYNGIAVISDGGENGLPGFAPTYKKYSAQFDIEPPIYFYVVKGSDGNMFSRNLHNAGIDVQEFDLLNGVDYVALPQLVQTMRTSRYGLIDEIMATPLLDLDVVLGVARREHA